MPRVHGFAIRDWVAVGPALLFARVTTPAPMADRADPDRALSYRGHRLLVLGFHNVEGTWRFPSPAGEGVRNFGRHMRILDRLANVVPLTDALDALASGRPLPPRAVALTFDDGYRDNLTLAAPILRRFHMPATIYLVPHFLSGSEHAWWERLAWAVGQATVRCVTYNGASLPLHDEDARAAGLRHFEDDLKDHTHAVRSQQVESLVDELRPNGEFAHDDLFLDWEAAREVVAAGLSVGSHTLEHAILARETPEEQRHDLRESRELLRRELQVEVETLAYPNGKPVDYDATTIGAARDAGYRYAVTTWGGPVTADDPPYEIHRTLVSPVESGSRFAAKLVKRLLLPT